jgi:hypothetical protein
MARDNSRVAQALLIIAREHSGCSARWERTLSRRLAIGTGAARCCKGFSTSSPRVDKTWSTRQALHRDKRKIPP